MQHVAERGCKARDFLCLLLQPESGEPFVLGGLVADFAPKKTRRKNGPNETFHNFVREISFDCLYEVAQYFVDVPVRILGFVDLPLGESLRGLPAWATSSQQHPFLTCALCGVSKAGMKSLTLAQGKKGCEPDKLLTTMVDQQRG